MSSYPLETIRHSAAHVMAAAVKELFPDTRFDIGPSTDDGFYYDFDMEHRLIPEDLEKLESVMKRISGEKLPFKKMEILRPEAESLLKSQNQIFKLERLADIPEGDTITFYQCGDFSDLCRGPHVEHSGQVGVIEDFAVLAETEMRQCHRRLLAHLYMGEVVIPNFGGLLPSGEEQKIRIHRRPCANENPDR